MCVVFRHDSVRYHVRSSPIDYNLQDLIGWVVRLRAKRALSNTISKFRVRDGLFRLDV